MSWPSLHRAQRIIKFRGREADLQFEKKMEKRLVEIDLKYGHISKDEHDKKMATLKGEPWVKVIKMELEEVSDLEGTIRGKGGFGSTGK